MPKDGGRSVLARRRDKCATSKFRAPSTPMAHRCPACAASKKYFFFANLNASPAALCNVRIQVSCRTRLLVTAVTCQLHAGVCDVPSRHAHAMAMLSSLNCFLRWLSITLLKCSRRDIHTYITVFRDGTVMAQRRWHRAQ